MQRLQLILAVLLLFFRAAPGGFHGGREFCCVASSVLVKQEVKLTGVSARPAWCHRGIPSDIEGIFISQNSCRHLLCLHSPSLPLRLTCTLSGSASCHDPPHLQRLSSHQAQLVAISSSLQFDQEVSQPKGLSQERSFS